MSGAVKLPGSAPVQAVRIVASRPAASAEVVAEEVPVALVYNGISHAVMMATPLDLEDFALGFSLSEGIIARPGELLDCEVGELADGVTVELTITEARFQALKERRRSLTGRTGCGLCGQDTLEQAIRPLAPLGKVVPVAASEVSQAMRQLAAQQPLNAATGAVHAAGWWRSGKMLVREDVGRHNALDKLIGATAREAERDGLLVISSRASYEMVHKAASAGFGVLAAVSAPTALAVRLAEQAGLCLIGYAREDRMTVYSHPEHLLP
ncbi:formate dehydrogenase accessory sulfurtransferase FdhD [Chitinimonas sp.]|uniref:formate dehydrogenase accessory sulfurtransferase FdhD n=1 Tax=Chitinimonas sp. TaxID=1934313 RepID=UPI002F954EB5